jgi:hypothetical protein
MRHTIPVSWLSLVQAEEITMRRHQTWCLAGTAMLKRYDKGDGLGCMKVLSCLIKSDFCKVDDIYKWISQGLFC